MALETTTRWSQYGSAFLRSSWLWANGTWSPWVLLQIRVVYTVPQKEGCVYSPAPMPLSVVGWGLTSLRLHVCAQGCHANLSAGKVFIGIQSCRVWEALGQRVRGKSSWGELLSGCTYMKLLTTAQLEWKDRRPATRGTRFTTEALNPEGDYTKWLMEEKLAPY